uniref:Protein phosphatase 1 regulatory subunit 14D n=1 Tax=Junco hyemalis TaxID=40217 RepID=A0A8C5J097_JUNHY
MASNSSALPRVTFQTPEKPGEESSHRKLGKLTIKYNRKDLQRWLDLEEWINAQLQELYQCRLREETEAAAPEPQIDLEDLLEVPNEEQKIKLQEILHECSSPTEVSEAYKFTCVHVILVCNGVFAAAWLSSQDTTVLQICLIIMGGVCLYSVIVKLHHINAHE